MMTQGDQRGNNQDALTMPIRALWNLQMVRYGVGAGRLPSVTIFLSDGVVEVRSQGVRRRMGVRACDAFWFEAFTRLTVVHDDPVGAAIVQLSPAASS
jgi:hypothetical protein